MRGAIAIGLLITLGLAGCSRPALAPGTPATRTTPGQHSAPGQVDGGVEGTWSGPFSVTATDTVGEVAGKGCVTSGTMTVSLPPADRVVGAAIHAVGIRVTGDQNCSQGSTSGGGRLAGNVAPDGQVTVTDLVLCGIDFGPVDLVRLGPQLVSEFEAADGSPFTGRLTLSRLSVSQAAPLGPPRATVLGSPGQ